MAQSRYVAPAYNGPKVPYRDSAPPAVAPFYSNLGSTACTGCNYDTSNGLLVIGPANCFASGATQWAAVPFIAGKSGQVRKVQVAVTLDSALCSNGANKFQVAIYSDACAGPAALLGGPVTVTAPAAPCGLATANFGTTGPALTAGTEYWVVAETAANQTKFTGVWWQSYHELTSFNLNDGNGWLYPATYGPNDLAMSVQ